MNKRLSISIITPSYNQSDFIEETIASVQTQNILNIQHIIVDGGSTDGTVDVLKKYPHLEWVSEKDNGQADALRKGLEKATGEIIGWVNSDDYYEPDVFDEILSHFQDPDVKWIVGNLTYIYSQQGKFISDHSPVITLDNLYINPDIVRQQCTFFRRDYLEQVGGWNPGFYMVMDFDLWVRLAKSSKPKMIDKNFAYFRLHEEQKSSLQNIIRQSKEITAILKREKAPLFCIYRIRIKKRWQWSKGWVKTFLIKLGMLPDKYLNVPIRTK